MSVKAAAEALIQQKEIESLQADIIILREEVRGLHAELSQIRAVFDNLDRNGLLYGKEAPP